MTPAIPPRFIATTRKGLVVASFDSEQLGWAFIADRRKRGVKLELWRETVARERCRKALKVAAAGADNVRRLVVGRAVK